MKKIAVFPGSFNPIHEGHLHIIKRASELFDELFVLMAINENKTKTINEVAYQELVDVVKQLNLKNVFVHKHDRLTTDFAKQVNAKYLVRSIRNEKDCQYEIELFDAYLECNSEIEEVLFIAKPNLRKISSSILRKEK